MANKQLHLTPPPPRSRSPILLFTLSLLAFSLLFFLFSLSSSSSSSFPIQTQLSSSPTHYYANTSLHPKPEASFVTSLEHFLAHKSPKSYSLRDDTVHRVREEDVKRLDGAVLAKQTEILYSDPYYPVRFPIKVYVYEMPRKFTYDLLWLFRNTYIQTDNLTSNGSPVHRLIEQHSIDYWLWADLIAPESERVLTSVVRVDRQEEADLFYIPFFTTISYFLLEKQHCKALYRVKL